MFGDLQTGEGAWANIAQIVRHTFISVYERIRTHHERLKVIESRVAEDCSKHKEEFDRLEALIKSNEATVKAIQTEKDQCIERLESEVCSLKSQILDLKELIPKREELQRVLSKKVDVSTLESALQDLPDREEVSLSLKDMRTNYEQQLEELGTKVKAISNDVKPSKDSDVVKEFELLKETITCEMIIGRWIWEADRSGVSGWIETVNTSQLIFEMYSDIGVRILRQGFYEISLACFTTRAGAISTESREPIVQLLVNDQVVLSNETSASTNQLTSRAPIKKSSSAMARGILGWSISECFSLPDNAEITLRYKGDRAQGFINIKNIHCDF